MEHEAGGPTMQAQVLSNACCVEADGDLSWDIEVEVWLQLTEEGGVRFLRKFNSGQYEEAAYLPSKCFPRWIRQHYPVIDFWGAGLRSNIKLSVEYSGASFPHWK